MPLPWFVADLPEFYVQALTLLLKLGMSWQKETMLRGSPRHWLLTLGERTHTFQPGQAPPRWIPGQSWHVSITAASSPSSAVLGIWQNELMCSKR